VTSPEKESALEKLPENLRRFVEAIASGYTGIEAAKIAGSEANTRDALAVTASRWKKRPDVQAALAEIREEFLVDDDGLFATTMQALRDLLRDKSNPSARVKACELVLKLLHRLAPDQHLHAHLHAAVETVGTDPDEEKRLAEIVMRSLKLRCPGCGKVFDGDEGLPADGDDAP